MKRSAGHLNIDVETPSYWIGDGETPALVSTLFMKNKLQFLLRESALHNDCACCHPTKQVDMKNARVVKVERVENTRLWEQYATTRAKLRAQASSKRYKNSVTANPENSRPVRTDLASDERYLFHGTQQHVLDKISTKGFKICKSDNTFRRYGNGAYFSDQSCKSHQYTSYVADEIGDGKTWTMLYCRVLPGKTLDIKPGRKMIDRGGFHGMHALDPTDPVFSAAMSTSGRTVLGKGSFDSLVVRPRNSSKAVHKQNQVQVHNEFVVFEESQVYPEFVVHYRFDTIEMQKEVEEYTRRKKELKQQRARMREERRLEKEMEKAREEMRRDEVREANMKVMTELTEAVKKLAKAKKRIRPHQAAPLILGMSLVAVMAAAHLVLESSHEDSSSDEELSYLESSLLDEESSDDDDDVVHVLPTGQQVRFLRQCEK